MSDWNRKIIDEFRTTRVELVARSRERPGPTKRGSCSLLRPTRSYASTRP